MKESGLTQNEVSKITGVPEQSLGQMIKIRETVKLSVLLKVLYDIGVEVFFRMPGYVIINKEGTQDRYCDSEHKIEMYSLDSDNVSSDIMNTALSCLGIGYKEAEERYGCYRQCLEYKIKYRGSISANEFFEVMGVLGIETLFYMRKSDRTIDPETAKEETKEVKKKPRVMGMSDRVIYNTNEGTLVSSSFYADGKSEYGPDGKAQDLYIDKEGRYFAAEYSNEDGDKGRVRSVPYLMAIAFINQYGTKNNEE